MDMDSKLTTMPAETTALDAWQAPDGKRAAPVIRFRFAGKTSFSFSRPTFPLPGSCGCPGTQALEKIDTLNESGKGKDYK
jgi:hypothetical protein